MAKLSDDERLRREAAKALRAEVAAARRAAVTAKREGTATRAAAPANASWLVDERKAGEPATSQPLTRKQRRRARGSTRTAKQGKRIPLPTLVDQIVSPEARAHGVYDEDIIAGPVVGRNGQEKVTTSRVVRNRGGTTVERWLAKGDITRRQAEAISLYCRAWRMHIGEQRVVANWSLVSSFRGGTTDFDAFVENALKAKRLLKGLDEEVFFRLPLGHFNVFQNVVIYDEAAGVAGCRLGYTSKQAEAVAKLTVLMMADMIADVLNLGEQISPDRWTGRG